MFARTLNALALASCITVFGGTDSSRADVGDQFPPLVLVDVDADGWLFEARHDDGTVDQVAGDWSIDGWQAFAEVLNDVGDQFPPTATTLSEHRRKCRESAIRECCNIQQGAPTVICACFRGSQYRRTAAGDWECVAFCC
jgi:hypothetical protein